MPPPAASRRGRGSLLALRRPGPSWGTPQRGGRGTDTERVRLRGAECVRGLGSGWRGVPSRRGRPSGPGLEVLFRVGRVRSGRAGRSAREVRMKSKSQKEQSPLTAPCSVGPARAPAPASAPSAAASSWVAGGPPFSGGGGRRGFLFSFSNESGFVVSSSPRKEPGSALSLSLGRTPVPSPGTSVHAEIRRPFARPVSTQQRIRVREEGACSRAGPV